MPISRVQNSRLRALLTLAAIAATFSGCTLGSPKFASRGSQGSPAVAQAQKKSAPATLSASEFGDTEQAAENEPTVASASPIRQSAWSKLKGAISRPQPIPLPGGDSASVTEEGEQQPFTTVDGRDF